MQPHPPLPIFQSNDLDWALGELIQLAVEAKRAGLGLNQYRPGLKARCMAVIGLYPPEMRYEAYQIVRLAAEKVEGPKRT